MNERIKELAEQAEMSANKGDHVDVKIMMEKFAELIVRECAQALEAEIDTWENMTPYQGSMKRKGTTAIKQHFGVES